MSNENIINLIAENWDKISNKIKQHWDQISDEQLENIEGSYDNLVATLKDAYGYTARTAKKEIDDFVEELNQSTFESVKENLQQVGDTIYTYKDKFDDCEKVASNYIKKNPLTAVGIALAAGFVASRLISLIK